MKEEIKSVSLTEGKDKKKIEKTIRVEEITNGFIITEDKNFYDKKGEYKYETVKVFSKTNPLAESTDNLSKVLKKNMPGS